MKKLVQLSIAVIAIILAFYIIFIISPTAEFAINFITISFGLLAIIWAYKAYNSLAPNSSLRNYSLLFALALTLIVVYRIVVVFDMFLLLPRAYDFFGYFTIALGYLLFAVASYKILEIGKEFGFAESTKIIRQALKDKKKKK